MRTRLGFTLLALVALLSLYLVSPSADPAPKMTVTVVTVTEAPPTSLEQILKTARVTFPVEGQASCFPIAEVFGCVAWLTNKHVVEEMPVLVVLPNGDRAVVLKTVEHPTRDIGIIWTAANPALPMKPIPLADTPPAPGADAWHGGYPVYLGLWLSRGLVGFPDSDGDIWCSVPVSYGCSGGPLVVDGVAVAVVMGLYVHGSGFVSHPMSTISCVVPIVHVRDWITESLAVDPRGR